MTRRYGDPSWNLPEPADLPDKKVSRRSLSRLEVQSPRAKRLPMIELAGVELHAITERETIDHIMAELDDGRGGIVVTPNLDHLRRCARDLQFHAMVSEADLAVADGMPVIWASRLAGTPLPERVAGSNLIHSLNAEAAGRGKRVFFLGGDPGAAEGAVKVLKERHPDLQVVGIHFPPMGFDKNAKLWAEMCSALIDANPDIIFVALGSPKQEVTAYKLQPLLPNAWWLGVGNSFSFVAGKVQRAPKWMQKAGLEWVHRLWQEPSKLWKRYLVSGVPFAISFLASSAYRGLPNRINRWRYGRRMEPTRPTDPTPKPPNPTGDSQGTRSSGSDQPGTTEAQGETSASTPSATSAASNRRVVEPANHPIETIYRRLRAVILLGGSVRPSPLSAATGRSVLDLPLDENGSILNYWLSQAQEIAKLAGQEKVTVRVLVNQAAREPTSAAEKFFGTFRVELDGSEFRGTGGVLRDVAAEYDDDDFILVANACQILLDPLTAITVALAKQGGDVNLISHDDGTPSGVQLLRCKTLREIGHNGYHDMKEQWLPKIAEAFDVRVVRRRRPTGLPIRALEDYIQALRLYHRRLKGQPMITDPLAEDWTPSFSYVEPGATVATGVRVHDSVVLAGANVETGAVLVRSLVCGDATIKGDKTVVDEYVTAAPTGTLSPIPVAAAW